ncbi:MAG: SpoIIIAH-like family protein [Oscillospiraceae bacterium]|nr:SpoIIIAH-like family protein [Oscillospiraceae bacterium]
MSFGKRQLILAALVVSLGAAVYLNWQFSGKNDLQAVEASTSEKELGTAQLVNGSDVLTSQPETSESQVESAQGGVLSNAEQESTSEGAKEDAMDGEAEATAGEVEQGSDDYFAEACLARQKTRDEAVEMLNQVLNDSEATTEETQKAVEQSSEIAKNMLAESNIESMVKSKGYTDCVAFLQDGTCNVVVGKSSEFTAEDAATIQDIVVGQSDVSADQIKIVDHQTTE